MAVRKADVVERVYARLKRRAIEFGFAPGEKVKEGVLAAEFGVSRTPVREALNRLSTEGFVTFVPNRGFYCRKVDTDQIAQIYAVRAALEVWAFRCACAATPEGDLAAFHARWGGKDVVAGFETLDIYDSRFHSGMAALCGNRVLLQELREIDEKILAFRSLELPDIRRRDQMLAEHGQILSALVSRDAAGGSAMLERHILNGAEKAIAAAGMKFGTPDRA
ncbi:GntR family transcriptional regulator [Defluviimonas sp. 20V17]|uniref:Transcriptional regulator n=1 Tax=Allgaiera indica TaxID=765699 RepID=A0AAN4USL5_9RHOB|nr:GntR family transcriptional regulator [Allgaiera indica]KDB05597.1 GntR family transcriptional regulator [Defluviimonas sp. 20V17]GHE03468.1 transcriptional regulator [Allgaiera indica]SDX42641.1 DNA-binding transcriptional regulator, GntR family [Allgaiera indica]